jgi:hypothetical protein
MARPAPWTLGFSAVRTAGLTVLRTLGPAVALATAAWAGPNADAVLHVDADPLTPAIDSSLPRPTEFRIAVRVSGAVHLDGYSFELQYDTAQVAFLGAVAGSPTEGLINILETRGGRSAAFLARPSVRGGGWLTLANTLTGSDSTRSPSGDGLLAVLSFQGKRPGIARFTPGTAELQDYRQVLDTGIAFIGASVDVQPTVALRRASPWVLRFRESGDPTGWDPSGRRSVGSAIGFRIRAAASARR